MTLALGGIPIFVWFVFGYFGVRVNILTRSREGWSRRTYKVVGYWTFLIFITGVIGWLVAVVDMGGHHTFRKAHFIDGISTKIPMPSERLVRAWFGVRDES